MSAPEILSLIVSFIGVFTAIVAIYYTIRQKRVSISIKAVNNRDDGLKTIFQVRPKSVEIMGVSLRGLLRYPVVYELIKLVNEADRCQIKILILNPYSIASFKVAQRESELEDTRDYYKSYLFLDILNTLKELSEITKKYSTNGKITIRLYDEIPLGMLVITEDHCLFEPYSSPEMRQIGSFGPSILINKTTNESSSLYNHMRDLFNRTWEKSVLFSEDLKSPSLDELTRIRNMLIHDNKTNE